jgi:predicted nucleic acid-binding protein
VRAVDTSVAVAAFGEWHKLNRQARGILDEGALLPVHAMLETYAVLTGFPPPYRASPAVVDEWLQGRFDGFLAAPSPAQHAELVSRIAVAGRAGASIYDALIGFTAKLAGAELYTADLRASAVYDLLKVDWREIPMR